MITILSVQYTGEEASCLLVADATAGTLTSSVGDAGSESVDSDFGTEGVMDLSGLTVAELVTAIDAIETYEAEVTSGDESVSAEVIATATCQAAGLNAYFLFEPSSILGADALITWETLYSALTVSTSETLDDDDREYGEGLINAASVRANSITKRKLASRTYTDLKLDGTGRDTLKLPEYPVSAVSELAIDALREFGTDTVLDPDDGEYYLYADEGIIYVPSGIPLERLCVQITLTAGYATVPYDLQRAIVEACVYSWKQSHSRALGTRSITADGVTTQYEIDIPMPAMRVIESYRRTA